MARTAYASTADLPDRVKTHIPPHAQKIFRAVFNSVLESTGDETRAFKSAWSKVHKNYGNPGNKNWRKRKPFKYESQRKAKSTTMTDVTVDVWDLIKARGVKEVRPFMTTTRSTPQGMHVRQHRIVKGTGGFAPQVREKPARATAFGSWDGRSSYMEVGDAVHQLARTALADKKAGSNVKIHNKTLASHFGKVAAMSPGEAKRWEAGAGGGNFGKSFIPESKPEEIEEITNKSFFSSGKTSHTVPLRSPVLARIDHKDIVGNGAESHIAEHRIVSHKGKFEVQSRYSKHGGARGTWSGSGLPLHDSYTSAMAHVAGIAKKAREDWSSDKIHLHPALSGAAKIANKQTTKSEEERPTSTFVCGTCGGTGYLFTGDEEAVPSQNAEVKQETGNSEEVLARSIKEETVKTPALVKSVGQFCFSCEKSTEQGAIFSKLPDSGYCDSCLTMAKRY